MPGEVERIALPCVFESETFARYEPFGDGRFVVARRGAALGFHYGLEVGRRQVAVGGGLVEVVRVQGLLPDGAGAVEYDVLAGPGVELCVQVSAGGFSAHEVERIFAAVHLAGASGAG